MNRRTFLTSLLALIPGVAILPKSVKAEPPPKLKTKWELAYEKTIRSYLRSENDRVLCNHKMMRLLREKGRITFSSCNFTHRYPAVDWKVRAA